MTEENKTENAPVVSTETEETPKNPTSQEDVENYDMSQAVPEGGTSEDIDWDCPCIAYMMKSPCVESFKEAFSCFIDSKEEMKGSDCVKPFIKMQECIQENAEYFKDLDLDSDDEEDVQVDDEKEEVEDKKEEKKKEEVEEEEEEKTEEVEEEKKEEVLEKNGEENDSEVVLSDEDSGTDSDNEEVDIVKGELSDCSDAE